MSRRFGAAAGAVFVACAGLLFGEEVDLRKEYGTPSLAAAKKIAEAAACQAAGDTVKGSAAIETALRADPKCAFAVLIKARLFARPRQAGRGRRLL